MLPKKISKGQNFEQEDALPETVMLHLNYDTAFNIYIYVKWS